MNKYWLSKSQINLSETEQNGCNFLFHQLRNSRREQYFIYKNILRDLIIYSGLFFVLILAHQIQFHLIKQRRNKIKVVPCGMINC